MYDRGEVIEVSAAKHQVRVKFPSRDDVSSPWLDVLVGSTHGRKEFRLPPVGNQVACLLDDRGESGCVIGSVYSEPDPVPEGASAEHVIAEFPDGAWFSYDPAAHRFKMDLPSGALADLCGSAMKLALADLVAAKFDAWAGVFDGHTHPAGALTGGGPAPIAGMTGAPSSSAPSTGELGSAQLRSA